MSRIGSTQRECCEHCDYIGEHGIIIADEDHASYLEMIDHDFGAEGVYMNYRDEK